jgi:hypothetical protein
MTLLTVPFKLKTYTMYQSIIDEAPNSAEAAQAGIKLKELSL